MTKAWGSRFAVVTGALIITLAGLGAPASAAPDDYGDIDFNAMGALHIHKHLSGDGTIGKPDSTGQEGDQVVPGVTFAAYEITSLDLTVTANWDVLSALQIPSTACAGNTPEIPGQTVNTSAAATGVTNDLGIADLTNLRVAAYLVCETAAPPNIIDTAEPFVVTIPYPYSATDPADQSNAKWLYDVHAYPKNKQIEITKSIAPQAANGFGLGSVITFPVSTILPSLDANMHYSHFYFSDTMDARLTNLGVANVTLDGTELKADSDYLVTVTEQTVTVSFTTAGLAQLEAAPAKALVANFQATISSLGNGTIENTATLVTDTQSGSVRTDEPQAVLANLPAGLSSSPVKTYWGDVQVLKRDKAAANGSALSGAKFKVYSAADPYSNDCSTATKTGDPIQAVVNGAATDTFTSDANGLLSIPGLYIGDSVGSAGEQSKDATQRCYVLEEVAAPAGYVLPAGGAELIPVTVTIGATNTANGYDATVTNTKQAVPSLPLTGGLGPILVALGATLLLAAVATHIAARRRNAAS